MKKIIGIFILLFCLAGCSSLSVDKIVTLSKGAMKQHSQKSLKTTFDEYFYEDEDEDTRRIMKEDAEYRIERADFIKRKILDSIGIDHKSLIIFDIASHDYAGEYEVVYVFYDDKILRGYQREFSVEFNPKILEVKQTSPGNDLLFALHKHFNKQNHKEIEKTIDYNLTNNHTIARYYVTVVLNKKVKCYTFDSLDLFYKRVVLQK